MISIKDLDKAAVLAALHNNTQPLGRGILHAQGPMTVEQARSILDGRSDLYFDYVAGRPIKVDLSGDSFDPRLYDRDAGPGAAQQAIDSLR